MEYIIKSELGEEKEQKAIHKNDTGISERFQKNLNVLIISLKTKGGDYFGKEFEKKCEQTFLDKSKTISNNNESEEK